MVQIDVNKLFETNTYKKLLNNKINNKPNRIIVHHSGGTDANPMADTSEHTAKGMELWHIGKGWIGLGYHYVIHKNGDIWKGRPEHVNGAHSVADNTESIGICLSGNFDATLPTKEQEESLKVLMLNIMSRHGITTDKIYPHRHSANKTCYGKKLSDTWASELAMLPVITSDELSWKPCAISIDKFTNGELLIELKNRLNNIK
jgi:hypothetical protein